MLEPPASRQLNGNRSRTMNMTILRDRLQREDYAVDPHKVADAIVERLLATSAGSAPASDSSR
jgi:hypothetical protein